MKKIILPLLIVIAAAPIFAQNEVKRAHAYFDRAFYMDAIPLYEETVAFDKSKAVVQNLADSYYHTFQMRKAAKWYGYLTKRYPVNLDKKFWLRYSHALKAAGYYQKGITILKEYYQENPQQLAILEKQQNYLENVAAIGNRFEIKNLAINTEQSEFGAIIFKNNFFFSRSKIGSSPFKKTYGWNNQNYLDIYTISADSLMQKAPNFKPVSSKVNTKLHEASIAVSKDGKTLYFTRNNYYKGKKTSDKEKITHLKIYRAEWINGQWDNITSLPFNHDHYSTAHPALSADEKTLFFASDRPGGQGSFDIYSVAINKNGSFGKPQNLGQEINTDQKEQFPFVDTKNDLYFASDGHPGFGLLDVFVAEFKNGKYAKPDNVGKPLNGGYDDFSYFITPDQQTGYFSSNRPTGKGSDDIYQFKITKPLLIENCKQWAKGILTDKITGDVLTNGTITLLNGTNSITVTTDTKGAFQFPLACSMEYTVKASKEAYASGTVAFNTDKKRNHEIDASIALISKSYIEEQERIAAEEQHKKEEAKKAQSLVQKEEAQKEKINSIIKTEKAIVKTKEKTIIKTEPIHFDYSLWYLRKKARQSIDKVIAILKKNPEIQLEIATHTDNRGNARYNKQLSQKRAESVKSYMIENGIAKNRIAAVGYGEAKPAIVCATEDACTEEQHELNRRCEFVITEWQ